MTYVLNKSLKMKQLGQLELFAPGQPCFLKCEECEGGATNLKAGCEKCNKVWNDCMQCVNNKPYELLKTGMVGGPSIIFCPYH